MKKISAILTTALAVLCIFTSCENQTGAPAAAAAGKGYLSVTFRTGTGDSIPAQLVTYGSKAKSPDVTELQKEGFGFRGWLLDGDRYDFDTPVIKDIVLVAEWDVMCTVVFLDSNGETSLDIPPEEITYYSKAAKPADPEKDGYTFVRWVDPTGAPYNFERPVSDTYLQLTAVWEPRKCTVTYNANGATEYSALPGPTTYTYGDREVVAARIDSTTGFSRTGYVFECWNTSPDGTGTDYRPGYFFEGAPDDMTLYAKWKKPEYELGDTGPTGGMIIAVNEDTSSAEWKYIEAAPLRLPGTYCFGYYRQDGGSNTAVGASGTGSGSGKSNTEKLFEAMQEEAPVEKEPRTVVNEGHTGTMNIRGSYGGVECLDYVYDDNGIRYDDWYLPAEEEMKEIFQAYGKKSRIAESGTYMTSTETDAEKFTYVVYCSDSDTAGSGTVVTWYKSFPDAEKSSQMLVWPVRYI